MKIRQLCIKLRMMYQQTLWSIVLTSWCHKLDWYAHTQLIRNDIWIFVTFCRNMKYAYFSRSYPCSSRTGHSLMLVVGNFICALAKATTRSIGDIYWHINRTNILSPEMILGIQTNVFSSQGNGVLHNIILQNKYRYMRLNIQMLFD